MNKMKKKLSHWIFAALLLFSSNGFSEIHVICTSALISQNYAMRKQEYIKSLKIIIGYGYLPYIFESCHSRSPSFFEKYTDRVCYTNSNDYQLKNKGVNEGRAIIEGFRQCRFNDDDMIVKLTGRYWFNSRDFLETVENHSEVDAFFKYTGGGSNNVGDPNSVITGCYAMRYKLFKEMIESFDYSTMEREMIDIERAVSAYINQMPERGYKIMRMGKLGITANIGSNNPPVYTHQ
jgi:hypothetical protein